MTKKLQDIAIVSLAGRFPQCDSVLEYWHRLSNNENLISKISKEELLNENVAEDVVNNPNYTPYKGLLNDVYKFDPYPYGLLEREARFMDPQQRIMLDCISEAFSNFNYNKHDMPLVGTYLGVNSSSYYLENILNNTSYTNQMSELPILIGNGTDYFATRMSYLLGFSGPSLTIQTACSTSLVTVHMACQALRNYECDIAIAGGASVTFPNKVGYFYTVDSIYSKDGVCRPFDINASGTVFSDGAGVVVLKRLADAIADKDSIYAVIKASTVNNDSGRKESYSAPSVIGQAECIGLTYKMADINPETIGYIEAHGTGTIIGDPIEIRALTEAFKIFTKKRNYCSIGSVKGNIGHLITAAGIASLIKTALCLNYKTILPLANFTAPNKYIDFDKTPFIPEVSLKKWQSSDLLRAGVSSFGIGGTNVHMILEEYSKTEYIDLESKSYKQSHGLLDYKLSPTIKTEEKSLVSVASSEWNKINNIPQFSFIEKLVFSIWSEVLEKYDIGKEANLFELGADSLCLLEIVEKTNKVLKVEITLHQLTSYPTIRDFSALLLNMLQDFNKN